MFLRVRFFRIVPLAALGLIVAALIVAPLLSQSPVEAQGNSQNVKTCQKGGWQTLKTADGRTFANQGECVSAGAQGAVLVPISASTQVPPTQGPPTEVPPTQAPPTQPPVYTPQMTLSFAPMDTEPGGSGSWCSFSVTITGAAPNQTIEITVYRYVNGGNNPYVAGVDIGPDGTGVYTRGKSSEEFNILVEATWNGYSTGIELVAC